MSRDTGVSNEKACWERTESNREKGEVQADQSRGCGTGREAVERHGASTRVKVTLSREGRVAVLGTILQV